MIRMVALHAAALAGLAMVPTPAAAYTIMTGEDLARHCMVDRNDPAQLGSVSMCIGYVRATFERMWVSQLEAGKPVNTCLPRDLSNEQILDAVVAEMERHPPGNGILATQLVQEAIVALHPDCWN